MFKRKKKVIKRASGQLTEKDKKKVWLVLTESKRRRRDWIHSCGKVIKSATIYISHRTPGFSMAGNGSAKPMQVPYCPRCERVPKSGTAYPGKFASIVS